MSSTEQESDQATSSAQDDFIAVGSSLFRMSPASGIGPNIAGNAMLAAARWSSSRVREEVARRDAEGAEKIFL